MKTILATILMSLILVAFVRIGLMVPAFHAYDLVYDGPGSLNIFTSAVLGFIVSLFAYQVSATIFWVARISMLFFELTGMSISSENR